MFTVPKSPYFGAIVKVIETLSAIFAPICPKYGGLFPRCPNWMPHSLSHKKALHTNQRVRDSSRAVNVMTE